MRVITGIARGRKLETPPGLDTRPTTEMVKEAVFSAIQFEIEGAKVLDLFAGSGQMGIEALSRGAAHCVFVDSSRASREAVRRNLASTGFDRMAEVVASDAFSYLKRAQGPFDIAFLDPPYGQGMAEKALGQLAPRMRGSGIIFCETARDEALPELLEAGEKPLFRRFRRYRYGKIMVTQYRGPQED